MTCDECRVAAAVNRRIFDGEDGLYPRLHPEACECTCQHEPLEQWEKMYGTERPVIETEH